MSIVPRTIVYITPKLESDANVITTPATSSMIPYDI